MSRQEYLTMAALVGNNGKLAANEKTQAEFRAASSMAKVIAYDLLDNARLDKGCGLGMTNEQWSKFRDEFYKLALL